MKKDSEVKLVRRVGAYEIPAQRGRGREPRTSTGSLLTKGEMW
jgi:hypothetical protein